MSNVPPFLEHLGSSVPAGRGARHSPREWHSGTRLPDPPALQRIRLAEQQEDPALVIGAAEELIESTAKLVLTELGQQPDRRADIQKLIRQAQDALHLLPGQAPGPDGTDAIKKILGGAAAIAIGVAELRNRGYGTGHGPASPRHGLSTRHAHLAANTWCELILETLADPQAPWRKSPTPATSTGK